MNHQRRKYGYSYDHQHRLTAAYYQLPGTVIPRSDSYSTSYSYDENGNILSLKRNGKEDDPNLLIEIDDLDYTYDQGNRLLKVKDATNDPAGFNMNGAGIHEKYAYDDFGNLKTDPYKKISHISYNHLNLPVKITFTGGETVEYTYLADGTKIEKTATDSENNTTTTEYRDGFQYKNNILEFFPHAEGYVKSTESVNGYIFNYVFTHTDHLGNIRIKYTKHPQTGELQILEEDHYYPYGLTHEGYSGNHQIFGFDNHTFTLIDVMADETDTYKYKFGGKEFQDELGLAMYDYGFRDYDPALGRWNVVDQLSEMYQSTSPYAYVANNPLINLEIDGRYFEQGSKSERQATRIERRAENRANRLERKADRLDAKGKSTGDLRDRAGELRQSAQDVRDMRNDQSTEYKYAKLNSQEAKSLGLAGPTTTLTGQNDNGDNVVTMFTEKNMGNQIHETRHGGQNARGEFNVVTGAGYGVADEVSAYRVQYSWSGKLQYIPFTDFSNSNNMTQMMTQGIQSFIQNITNINQITPNFVNTLVDNPGLMQMLIYPPASIPLNIWNSN